MEEQTYRNDPELWEVEQDEIAADGIVGVERVKADAATVGIKNGVGQQVVQVYEHGGQHDEPGVFPLFPEKYPGYEAGCQKVQAIVYRKSYDFCGLQLNRWFHQRMIRLVLDQVPQITIEVLKNRYSTIVSFFGRPDKYDAFFHHLMVISPKIICI